MTYTLMFYLDENEFADRKDPEKRAAFWGAFMPYMTALQDSGIVLAGAGLQDPETATSIVYRGGQRSVQDGPFTNSKEQLGGFFVIDVPDLETAMQWASRYPAGPNGGFEVRPGIPNGENRPGLGSPPIA